MSDNLPQAYKVEKTRHWSLPSNYGDFKKELYASNQTGIVIVIIGRERQPVYVHPRSINESGSFIIHSSSFSLYDPTKSINTDGKEECLTFTLSKTKLSMSPIYVEELGICVGIRGHETAMMEIIENKLYNPIVNQIRELMTERIHAHGEVGVVGTFCTHDRSIKEMYGMWNGVVYPLLMLYVEEQQNIVSFALKNEKSHAMSTMPDVEVLGEFGERYLEIIKDDLEIWYSESPDKLQSLYANAKKKQTQKLTDTENKLEIATKELAIVVAELDNTKKRLTTELLKNKTLLDDTKKTHEEHMMSMKLQHERVSNEFKVYQTEQTAIMQQQQHKQDLEVQQLKKDKELISAKSAEISAASNNMKTMVTTIPLAVSAAVLINNSLSNNGLVAAAASNPPVALGIAAAAAIASFGYMCLPEKSKKKVKQYGTSIYNYSKDIISKACKCVKKVAKKIKNVFSSIIDFFF